ncbi:MAG: tail fiber protein [Anaerolineae bacterium]
MEPFIGQVQLFPYNFAPSGWAFCEGQLLPISQNMPLFSLLGTTYGGDGRTTFALPDLKGKEPHPNMHYCIALMGVWPPRD